MKLSILIALLPEPFYIHGLKRLNNILDPQLARYPGQVEKIINDAGKGTPTGSKRNELIRGSEGEYFCFIDADDMVPAYYVDEIMKAIAQGPDVITFKGYMTTDGARRANFTIKLGSDYSERDGHYYRWPNHLTAMRRDRVEHIPFPPLWKQEDYQWSEVIHRKKLLKTEVHIESDMYWYDFVSPHRRQDYEKNNRVR